MTPVFRKTTDNAEAYRRYLQGRYEWSKCTQDGFRRSIDYFREAIHPDRTMLRLSAFRLVTMNPTRGTTPWMMLASYHHPPRHLPTGCLVGKARVPDHWLDCRGLP